MNHFAEAPTLFADHDDVQRVTPRAPSYPADHRKRLRERFNSGGAAAIPDYELLELVLFRAIPQQDVKPLARALIDTFRDFNGVLSAPRWPAGQDQGVRPRCRH
jgi:DNA repair protein RadC